MELFSEIYICKGLSDTVYTFLYFKYYQFISSVPGRTTLKRFFFVRLIYFTFNPNSSKLLFKVLMPIGLFKNLSFLSVSKSR